ncbi:hypothetical protein, partial [Photobacterium sp. R1]
ARFADMFLMLLDGILAAPHANVMQLPMVDHAHQDSIAQALASLPARVDAPMLIHDRVSRHAAEYPAQPAVTGFDRTLTYQELEQAANRL